MSGDESPPVRLLVILGAGASHDCVSATVSALNIHEELKPPLVTELFEPRPAFTQILHEYGLAEQAAADIRSVLASGSVALEKFLRDELRDSEFAHRRRQYWSIPLYLQHLLFNVSRWDGLLQGYTQHPDVYDRLVNATLRVPQVTFVTLNYDTILDQRLFLHRGARGMDDYLGDSGEGWALIKPHGSVDWGRRVLNPMGTFTVPDESVHATRLVEFGEELKLSDEIVLRRQDTVSGLRGLGPGFVNSDNGVFYPALSAPLGADDELVCPPKHMDYAKAIAGHYDPLDVLIIGYSGLDKGVLDLLTSGGRPLRTLTVVSESNASAVSTADRVARRVPSIREEIFGQRPAIFGEGFAKFVVDGHCDGYVAALLGRSQNG